MVSYDTNLLTMAEAAERLKVSRVTIQRWIKQGRLRSYKVGPRAVRIRADDLANLLQVTSTPVSRQPLADVHPPIVIRSLTPEEQAQALETVCRSRLRMQRYLDDHGGVPIPESWPLIRASREERSEQLGSH
ncbi:MAG: helix-turn-helix domain-containing protein [Chloroflexota bacterium]|nr:helix-turn-helix domain-containing protein [Chloroflexota bacterium]